jgi:NAD(P)-dependent dehydrogenase (short-subunit alcohol dehydrogenase family)
VLLVILGIFIAPYVSAQTQTATDEVQRAVLITGASSGIGRNTTEKLAASGTFVYAGARKQADMDALNALDNVKAVRLDVTIQAEIDAAVEMVRAEGRGLHGVVNNAGVAMLGPLVEIPESDLQFTLNVNVIGPFRINQAFLPLLLESKGRIINITSVSALQTNMMFGTYAMSKAAMESYNNILAKELAPFGVRVIAVEPGAFRSRLPVSAIAAMEARGLRAENTIYTKIPWETIQKGMSTGTGAIADWPEPDDVAYAIQDALFSESPKEHYMVVSSEPVAELSIRSVIENLVRFNEDQKYSYNRDELILMLDEELDGTIDENTLRRFGGASSE